MRTTGFCIVCALLITLAGPLLSPAAGANRAPAIEPELRILDVTVPETYLPQEGRLDFFVQVELPSDIEEGALLEVSSLISSPSKRSVRFLVSRQSLSTTDSAQAVTITPATDGTLQVQILLTWDGRDQSQEFVPDGRYQYEVRTKLLTKGERGLRTFMIAWPKRGTITVQTR